MDPLVFPVDTHAVLQVDALVAEGVLHLGRHRLEHGGVDAGLVFHDRVGGDLGDEFAEFLFALGKHLQDVGHADQRVADLADAVVDDPAVALAAEGGLVVTHALGDVGLADGGADDAAADGFGDVVDHPAGREVGGDGLAVPELVQGTQRERVLLADVRAGLIDDSQPVGVGVLREADVGAELAGLFA